MIKKEIYRLTGEIIVSAFFGVLILQSGIFLLLTTTAPFFILFKSLFFRWISVTVLTVLFIAFLLLFVNYLDLKEN